MDPIRISLISYLNSRPFVYGLQQSKLWNTQVFSFDVPAESARKVILQEVDMGIIPVATLPLVPNGHIVGDYCISAENEVYTVALFSNHPISEAQKVYLDIHSRTSVALTKILAPTIFNHNPIFVDGLPILKKENTKEFESSQLDDCYLLIGDKVFEYEHLFKYKMDLALSWKNQTGMPFVFAAWISNKQLPEAWLTKFNKALSVGVRNISQVTRSIEHEYPNIPVQEYLSRYIQFELTPLKRKSIEYFLSLTTSLS